MRRIWSGLGIELEWLGLVQPIRSHRTRKSGELIIGRSLAGLWTLVHPVLNHTFQVSFFIHHALEVGNPTPCLWLPIQPLESS